LIQVAKQNGRCSEILVTLYAFVIENNDIMFIRYISTVEQTTRLDASQSISDFANLIASIPFLDSVLKLAANPAHTPHEPIFRYNYTLPTENPATSTPVKNVQSRPKHLFNRKHHHLKVHPPPMPTNTDTLLPAHLRLTIPSIAIRIRILTFDLNIPRYSRLAAVVAVAPRSQKKSLALLFSDNGEVGALQELLRHVQSEPMILTVERDVEEETASVGRRRGGHEEKCGGGLKICRTDSLGR
jgi:hypothetical protein